MTAQEIKALQFNNFQANSNAPVMSCNFCGKEAEPTADWRYVEINIAPGADYTITVCSIKCEDAFMHHPAISDYVNDNIARMKKMYAGG